MVDGAREAALRAESSALTPRRVAVVVDHPARDLAGLVLVATALAARGIECALVPMSLQYREVLSLQPDVVLVNYLRRQNESRVRRFQQLGVCVAVLDSEGGIMRSAEEYGRMLSGCADVREGLGRYLSWGPELAARAVGERWFRQEQVAVTGNPRFDFYTGPLANALARDVRREYGLNDEVVLVIGSFNLANARFFSPAEEIALLVKQGHSREFLDARLRAEEECMAGLVRATRRLAELHPTISFVFRPHPFEEPRRYQPLFAGLENVRVIADGSVTPWIATARALIQRGSTTAVEAALAGKPVLEPRWLPSVNDVSLIDAACRPCKSFAELDCALTDAVSRSAFRLERSDVLERELHRWFFRVDGRAHVRVAGELEQLAIERPEGGNPRRFNDAAWGLDQPSLPPTRRLRRRVSRLLGRAPDLSDGFRPGDGHTWASSPRAFDRRSVAAIVGGLGHVGEPGGLLANTAGVEVVQCGARAGYRGLYGSGFSVLVRRQAPSREVVG